MSSESPDFEPLDGALAAIEEALSPFVLASGRLEDPTVLPPAERARAAVVASFATASLTYSECASAGLREGQFTLVPVRSWQ